MSHSNHQVVFNDAYIRETKMCVLSSFDNWKLHPMTYNEIKGCWEINKGGLKHGYQQ